MNLLYKTILELTANNIPVTGFHDEHDGTMYGIYDEAPATIFIGDTVHLVIVGQYINVSGENLEGFNISKEFTDIKSAIDYIKNFLDFNGFAFNYTGYYVPHEKDDYIINITD